MPIKIPDQLPAAEVLGQENIFVMTESRAVTQNIRPLRVLILNLMPKKIETEIQLMRMLSNSPLQVDVDLLRIDDRESKNTPQAHLENFYHDFEQVRGNNYDGMIITGRRSGWWSSRRWSIGPASSRSSSGPISMSPPPSSSAGRCRRR